MTAASSQEIKFDWVTFAGIMLLVLLLIGIAVVIYWAVAKLWPIASRLLQRRGVGNVVLIQLGCLSTTIGLSLLVAFGQVLEDDWIAAGLLAALATLLGLFAGAQTVEETRNAGRINVSDTLTGLLTLSCAALNVLVWNAGMPSYGIPWYIFLVMDALGYIMASGSADKKKEAANKQSAASQR